MLPNLRGYSGLSLALQRRAINLVGGLKRQLFHEPDKAGMLIGGRVF
jgi:hypothetical protein